jgi:hypothetical protein
MSKPPRIRKRYETHEDVMDDDGEPVDPDLERDENWHEKYRIVVDEDEAEL